jgi:hypothetical protein
MERRFDSPQGYALFLHATQEMTPSENAGARIDRITSWDRGDAAEEN